MRIIKFLVPFIFVSFVFSICCPVLTSCKSDESQPCDTLAIVKKYQEDHPSKSDTTEAFTARGLKFMANAKPDPITESIARNEHLDYLKGTLRLKDKNGDIIHYLTVKSGDLSTLAARGKDGGMRLYFSQKTQDGENYLSLVLVPVDANDDNVIIDNVTLINTLEPCPDRCAVKQKYKGKNADGSDTFNSLNDLNYDKTEKLWYKPNIDPSKPWVDKDNKPIK